MTQSQSRELLQKVPEELEKLLLDSRAIATNALSGLHRSPYRGSSIEFREHREYQHGDDLRRLDWRVYAKSDRLYVKQYEDETTLNIEIVIDASASMNYGSNSSSPTKFSRAQLLAAALSDLAIRQGDAARLWCFSDRLEVLTELRRQESHLLEIARRLVELEPYGVDAPSISFEHLASELNRKSIVIILSDVLFETDLFLPPLRSLQAKQFDLNLIRINDPQEVEFDFSQPSFFECPETSRQTFVHPNLFRKAYQAEWSRRESELVDACRQSHITLEMHQTSQDPGAALRDWIEFRQRALR